MFSISIYFLQIELFRKHQAEQRRTKRPNRRTDRSALDPTAAPGIYRGTTQGKNSLKQLIDPTLLINTFVGYREKQVYLLPSLRLFCLQATVHTHRLSRGNAASLSQA